MPLFNYECGACGHTFQLYVQSTTVPACPECESADLRKMLSSFAVGASGPARPAATPCGGQCSHPDGPGACQRG